MKLTCKLLRLILDLQKKENIYTTLKRRNHLEFDAPFIACACIIFKNCLAPILHFWYDMNLPKIERGMRSQVVSGSVSGDNHLSKKFYILYNPKTRATRIPILKGWEWSRCWYLIASSNSLRSHHDSNYLKLDPHRMFVLILSFPLVSDSLVLFERTWFNKVR